MTDAKIKRYGPFIHVYTDVEPSAWMWWSKAKDEFLGNCRLSLDKAEDRECHEYMTRVARSNIIRMRLGKGRTFRELLWEETGILRWHEESFFKSCPVEAKEVFRRTWAKLDGEWINWGWRAITMFVAKESGFWNNPYKEVPEEWKSSSL